MDQHRFDVFVGLDVGKHASHDVSLALQGYMAHHGAQTARDGHGVVTRIVVEHVDRRLRQNPLEITHDRPNRHFFVEAGYQYRKTQFVIHKRT